MQCSKWLMGSDGIISCRGQSSHHVLVQGRQRTQLAVHCRLGRQDSTYTASKSQSMAVPYVKAAWHTPRMRPTRQRWHLRRHTCINSSNSGRNLAMCHQAESPHYTCNTRADSRKTNSLGNSRCSPDLTSGTQRSWWAAGSICQGTAQLCCLYTTP